MIEFRRFNFEDLRFLSVQDRHIGHLHEALALPDDLKEYVQGSADALTAWVDGHPVACAGILDGWTWAFLAEDLRRHMVPVTRKAAEVLADYPGPVAAHVDESFPAGVRWATLLGFERLRPNVWVYA